MIKKTKYESFMYGSFPKGCRLCVTGEKSVLFVTGLCSQNCYYCSLSDNKKNKDSIIINEWETKDEKDIITEIKLCSSKGAGITGGDPLLFVDKTVHLIKLLKNTFGKNFHLHLYTPLKLVNRERLKKLYDAGLDEIRFHPDVDSASLWKNLEFAKEYDWDIGVEIPALPNKLNETKKLIDFLKGKIQFLNINELELSDNNFQRFEGLNYAPKNDTSYAIAGSLNLAKDIAEYAHNLGIKNVHVCTATLKDKYQLRQRILRRAKNSKKPFDHMTSEGMLIRGAIYLESAKLSSINVINLLKTEFSVPSNLLEYDIKRDRILTRIDVVEKLVKELKKRKLKPAIVEEYPTQDCFPVEVEFL